jgi:hypothetical protein
MTSLHSKACKAMQSCMPLTLLRHRGGIPVVFPQYGRGVLPTNGLLQRMHWSIADTGACGAKPARELPWKGSECLPVCPLISMLLALHVNSALHDNIMPCRRRGRSREGTRPGALGCAVGRGRQLHFRSVAAQIRGHVHCEPLFQLLCHRLHELDIAAAVSNWMLSLTSHLAPGGSHAASGCTGHAPHCHNTIADGRAPVEMLQISLMEHDDFPDLTPPDSKPAAAPDAETRPVLLPL